MRYLILSLFLFTLTSCGLSKTPVDIESSGASTVPTINVDGVQVSDSGTNIASDNGTISVGVDGTSSVTNGSGTISTGENGATITSGNDTMTAGKDGISVGTGIKIPVKGTDDMEKDPEVENITKDIDKIFSDIEKGGE